METQLEIYSNSRPIPTTEANRIISKRKTIYARISKIVASIFEIFRGKDAGYNYFNHQGNSFLFTKDSVLRHFFPNGDTTQQPFEGVTHLRVILGAHAVAEDSFEEGDPTICITGATQMSSRNTQTNELTFKISTPGDNPFDEHPPVEGVERGEKFIEDDGTFTIKII